MSELKTVGLSTPAGRPSYGEGGDEEEYGPPELESVVRLIKAGKFPLYTASRAT